MVLLDLIMSANSFNNFWEPDYVYHTQDLLAGPVSISMNFSNVLISMRTGHKALSQKANIPDQ